MKSIMKLPYIGAADTSIMQIHSVNYSATPSYFHIRLTPKPAIGTGHSQMVGSRIQIRSFKVQGLLQTLEQDVYIRWGLFRTKNYQGEQWTAPYYLLWSDDQTVPDAASDWNNPYRTRDDQTTCAESWQANLAYVAGGQITMPTTKLTTRFRVSKKFPVGKRPHLVYEDQAASTWARANDYILVIWANEDYHETTGTWDGGAKLTDLKLSFTYYDS